VFTTRAANYITLEQSYRTTIEIMNMANQVIAKLKNDSLVLAKPVIRHGEKPSYNTYVEKEKLLNELHNKITELECKYKSVAVICKTKIEALKIKKYIDKQNKVNSKLLDEKQESYEGGVLIVPSYLAKGLEFDVVLIVNIDEEYYISDLDIKLLYVAMTRALHEVHIYALEGKIPLLNEIDNQYFFHKSIN